MKKLDDTDQALLALLRSNARTPIVDLARRLGVSRATVLNRMRRLEDERVILGYSVLLPPEVEEYPVRALMSIRAESRREREIIELLRGKPEITAVHHTTGRWDLIAEIRSATLADFNSAVNEVRIIDGVVATESNLLLDSYE